MNITKSAIDILFKSIRNSNQEAFNRAESETLECYKLVSKFFSDDRKAHQWFTHSNPMLGGVSPVEMIVNGRGKKLLGFIKDSIDLNYRHHLEEPVHKGRA